MAVAQVAHVGDHTHTAMRRVLVGALPVAVGFAAAILLLTAGALLAGPDVLRDHANGATLALLGMGVPAHWAALSGRVAGSVALTDYPALLIASAVVAVATVAIGWFVARRATSASVARVAGPSAAWFAAFCGLAAVVVSHGRPLMFSGVSVRVAVSLPVTLLVSAVWGFVGISAGVVMARRVRRPRPASALSPWFVRAPGTAMVATAVTIMGLSACGAGVSSPSAARDLAKDRAATSTTTSTTIAPTATTAAATPTTGAATTSHATTVRAARKTTTAAGGTTGGGTTSAAAAAGFAPAAPGVYRYDTSGSTSSLLGNKAFPSVSTFTVDPATGTRQHSVRTLLAANGDGFIIDQVHDYQPTGVALVQQRLTMIQAGKKSVKTLNAAPTTLVIPLGTAIGSHGVLDLTGVGLAGHEVVDLVQAVTVPVGGQSVSGVLVRSVLTVTGSVSGTIQLDQWWSPSHRVPLKEQLSGTMKSGFVTVKTNYTATLQKLTP